MSERKKKLIGMLVGVFLCSLVVLVLGEFAMRSDQEEYARKCKSYEGIWKSKKGDFRLEIHRVSSGYLYFSMRNFVTNRNQRLLCASSIGEDTYEFSYATDATGNGRVYRIYPGQEGKGTIQLQENRVKVDFPKLSGKTEALEYTGVLTKKTEFRKEQAYHLTDYFGTKEKPEGMLAEYASFGYDEQGKVWRVHAVLAEDNNEYYKTDIFGITMNSSPSECEKQLGELTSEQGLTAGGWRRQYENDDFVSTCITNGYGVIREIDCQLANLNGMTRQGDFLMKGSTAYRYTGDYSKGKTIALPKSAKRIASHAFDVGEHGYTFSRIAERICAIDIPGDVVVEADAFVNCGPLTINLQRGWKEIPKGAFAHMVSLESISKKPNWVNIVLPSSLKKIGEDAFALGESTAGLEQYWSKGWELPIAITSPYSNLGNVTYIGDNAFWGLAMREIPPNVSYLGENYSVSSDYYEELQIPDHLTKLKKNTLYLVQEGMMISFPAGMEEIEDGAIQGEMPESCSLRKREMPETYGLWEEKKEIPHYMKEYPVKSPRWIMSEDGKILYFTDLLAYEKSDYEYFDRSYFEDIFEKGDTRYHLTEKLELIINIPEGVEEIRSGVSLHHGSQIILPKSLKKISVDALFFGEWDEVKIQGDVPEFYGDLSSYRSGDGNLDIPGTIKVRKGQKKKLIGQLAGSTKGGLSIKTQKKHLASHITTF